MQLSLALGDSRLPQVRDDLRENYGPQRDLHRHNPNDQFVKAMLSSCTKDAVSRAAFIRLHGLVPTWTLLPDIHPSMILRMVADVTHAPDKVCSLLQCIRIIKQTRGTFDLSFLADWPEDVAMSWLQKLPGVGPKIAAATLNFSSLHKRAFTVDRHVLRLCKRLGLLPGSATFVSGFRLLMQLVPPDWTADDLYELHWLMKMHGQRICRHKQPLCEKCIFSEFCFFFHSNSQHTQITANASHLH